MGCTKTYLGNIPAYIHITSANRQKKKKDRTKYNVDYIGHQIHVIFQLISKVIENPKVIEKPYFL